MSDIFNTVRPGDIISASYINQLVAGLNDLQQRIARLEATGPSTGPVVGFIRVQYKNSPRGVQVVPGDPSPFQQVFTVFNNTNQPLTMQLSSTVTGARGDWSTSVQFQNQDNVPINTVNVASGGSQDVIVAVRVPGSAVAGDIATLTVLSQISAPTALQGKDSVQLTVAAAAGPPVDRTVRFVNTIVPSNTTAVPPGTVLDYLFNTLYAASQAPLTETFTFALALTGIPPGNVGDWRVNVNGQDLAAAQVGQFSTQVRLNAGTQSAIDLKLLAPPNASPETGLTFTVTITSTDLPAVITNSSGPFSITLKKS